MMQPIIAAITPSMMKRDAMKQGTTIMIV